MPIVATEAAAVTSAPAKPRFRYFAAYDLVMLLYIAGSWLMAKWLGISIYYKIILIVEHDGPFLTIMVLYAWLVICFVAIRERATGRDRIICGSSWWRIMRRDMFNLQVAWDAVRLITYIKLLFVIYGNIKQAIPRLNPTLYDQQLYLVDRIASLGLDPIEVTHWLFSVYWPMRIMDSLYVLWYPVIAPVLVVFLLTGRTRLRTAFYTCFFLTWILGGLMAVAAPSLGPIYANPERFAHIAMPSARVLQDDLWVNYQAALADPEKYNVLLYRGIAAFPSLHVAVIALFAIFLFHMNRWAGWAMSAYTLIVLLGSVLLGWHYAVDGYAGILLVLLLYMLVRPTIKHDVMQQHAQ